MTENRLMSAIDRLDKAVARIETANIANRPDSEVEKKHEQLKNDVRAAIAEMDRILSRSSDHG